MASSHRSRKHHGNSASKDKVSRPPLTADNLSQLSGQGGSVAGSRKGSRHGSERGPPPAYQKPYFENYDSRLDLTRRNTEKIPTHTFGVDSNGNDNANIYDDNGQVTYAPWPALPRRANSTPEIDMNLAYGPIPPPLPPSSAEDDLRLAITRLDALMLEAQCIQHTATTIIASLQKNPDAMAAVALTLAEISNLVSKMSPSILTVLKGASPAIFGLLASPQFLIATGVAVGVTVVMFGGYKIIKKMQDLQTERQLDACRPMEEALVYERGGSLDAGTVGKDFDEVDAGVGSIDSWRRGIAEEEARSVATSVDGEFITPEAARVKRERISERAREERRHVDEERHRVREEEKVRAREERWMVDEERRREREDEKVRAREERWVAGDEKRAAAKTAALMAPEPSRAKSVVSESVLLGGETLVNESMVSGHSERVKSSRGAKSVRSSRSGKSSKSSSRREGKEGREKERDIKDEKERARREDKERKAKAHSSALTLFFKRNESSSRHLAMRNEMSEGPRMGPIRI